ncbi:DNA topoisomerase 3-alpha [Eumeta japonica]|uniref:DNA topoisomerase n=1 Tax=Eumeta variegata TaxID=151549 RepID=A0A4C1VAH6_EUMVA|nr:DNA topoisomerase 3-alpha [Eumeta japonica]
MKYLNVAEKNDAAKNIAFHLSRGSSRRREGLSQYNKIYDFEVEVLGQKSQMIMTSVSGHLLALEFAGPFKNWQSCDPLTLFEAPVFKYCPENYCKIKELHSQDSKHFDYNVCFPLINHRMNNLNVEFSWDRIRLFDQEACQVLHDICTENPQARVCEVKTKPKSKWRPLPLDTVELEKLASRKLKINAKETMRIAEKLYTQGLISYPRTETNEFPKEMNLGQLIGLQTQDPNWGGFAQNILDSGGATPRQGNKSDKAHPPIHPTKYTNNLTGNEQRIYEFIVRSFLACCSKDAQGQETSVTIDIAGEKFSATGLMITARNYLDVYPYEKWSSKEIHIYENGQTFDPTVIEMVEGSTSPPNLLTEADLIALMEKHGIGTDATHAEHIETIKNRSYVALANAVHFVPGLLGMGLVEGYDAMGLHISKPHLRAQLEADLKAISEGRKQPQAVLAEQIAKYKEVYITVTAEALKIDNALAERLSEQPNQITSHSRSAVIDMTPVLKCPKCGSDMIKRLKKNSDEYYISCVSFPACKNAVWLPNIVRTLEILPETCSQCGPNYKKIKFHWRNNSINHLYPPPYVACIGGCDLTFLEMMNINLSTVKAVPQNRAITSITRGITSEPSGPISERRPPTLHQQDSRDHPRTFVPPFLPNDTRRENNQNSTSFTPTNVNDNVNDNNVICYCNKQAILLTVKKQNANFGKKFYKCLIGKENGGCDFFQWAFESIESSESSNLDSSSSNSWGSTSNTTKGWGLPPRYSQDERGPRNEDNVKCQCGLICKKYEQLKNL